MIKTYQSTPTNCYAACLASILECPIEDISLGADGAHWNFDAIQEWIYHEYGLQIIDIYLRQDENTEAGAVHAMFKDVYCIISGKTSRNTYHAVVAKGINKDGFELIHDPHKDNIFLETHEQASFLVPVNSIYTRQRHCKVKQDPSDNQYIRSIVGVT